MGDFKTFIGKIFLSGIRTLRQNFVSLKLTFFQLSKSKIKQNYLKNSAKSRLVGGKKHKNAYDEKYQIRARSALLL